MEFLRCFVEGLVGLLNALCVVTLFSVAFYTYIILFSAAQLV